MKQVDTGVLGNELRLGVLFKGKRTGLWEPELLLVISCKNMKINLLNSYYVVILDLFEIFCLNVKMYL